MGRTTVIVAAIAMAVAIALEGTQSDTEWQRDWNYAAGAPGETLYADADAMPMPAAVVSLPHRVLEPNRALWYARDLAIAAGSALVVDADDGAQVFVDGVQLQHHRRWFIVSDASRPIRRVIIRVLNNAMQGGLRSVRRADRAGLQRDTLDRRAPIRGMPPVESGEFRRRMPEPGQPCRFTAWADSQGRWETFASIVALMRQQRSHFSVGVGDLVNDGSDVRAWQAFLDTVAPLAADTPVIAIAGNHDYDGFYNDLSARHYQDLFRPDGASWFAWSCGPARLAAIDLNREFPIGISAGSPQHRWLMEEIRGAAWREARWRILLAHQPPSSRSWEGYDGDDAMRTIAGTVAGAVGLDLVIAGHSHAYERLGAMAAGKPVAVLITGGAGGGLEAPLTMTARGEGRIELRHHFARLEVTRDQLVVEAVGLDGAVFDRWTLEK